MLGRLDPGRGGDGCFELGRDTPVGRAPAARRTIHFSLASNHLREFVPNPVSALNSLACRGDLARISRLVVICNLSVCRMATCQTNATDQLRIGL